MVFSLRTLLSCRDRGIFFTTISLRPFFPMTTHFPSAISLPTSLAPVSATNWHHDTFIAQQDQARPWVPDFAKTKVTVKLTVPPRAAPAAQQGCGYLFFASVTARAVWLLWYCSWEARSPRAARDSPPFSSLPRKEEEPNSGCCICWRWSMGPLRGVGSEEILLGRRLISQREENEQ